MVLSRSSQFETYSQYVQQIINKSGKYNKELFPKISYLEVFGLEFTNFYNSIETFLLENYRHLRFKGI